MLNNFINFDIKNKIKFFKTYYKKKTIIYNYFNYMEYLIFLENKFLLNYKNNVNYYKEFYLRCKSDFENFKKRSNEEVSKSYKYSIEDFSENLLPVIDSLESSLVGKFSNNESILDGIRLILRLFFKVLEKKNINFILPKEGDVFDPYKHLAISTVSCPDKDDNVIVKVFQKGYYIFDRILRPALVVVNKVK